MLAAALATALLLPAGAAAQDTVVRKRIVGGTLVLRVPQRCVRRGQTFRATVSFARADDSGNVARRITRVTFVVGGSTQAVDRSAPFRRTLRARGRQDPLVVLARIRLALRDGSGSSTLTAPVDVCG